jgi:hypothetical protein
MTQQLSQQVEKEVRFMLGDQLMQIIVLRQMLEMGQQQMGEPANPQPGNPPQQPNPTPPPHQPGHPGPSPDIPPPNPNRSPQPDPARDKPIRQEARSLNGERQV